MPSTCLEVFFWGYDFGPVQSTEGFFIFGLKFFFNRGFFKKLNLVSYVPILLRIFIAEHLM